MKFELTPGSDCRVKVLRELPDFRIGRLEGRNGIGKSMALRLLQLCTGDQPYRAAEGAVWRELKKALGTVSISCSNISGASAVVWQIDSGLWPEEPQGPIQLIGEDGHPGICANVTIDGTAADLPAVQSLLRVHRLAGDETLAQAIHADVADIKTQVEAEGSVESANRATASTSLEGISQMLEAASPEVLETATKTLTDAQRNLLELTRSAKDAFTRHEELKGFALRRAELSDLAEKHDDPEGYVNSLEAKLAEFRTEQATLHKERDSLNLDIGRNEQALKRIGEVEQELTDARKERETLLEEGHRLTRTLGLLAVPASHRDASFLAPQKLVEDRLATTREVQANIDSGSQVSALGDRVLNLLGASAVAPIRTRPFATLDQKDGQRISAGDLEDGIRIRQTEIENETRPPQSEDLERELRGLEESLEAFNELASIIRKVRIRDTRITRARDELKNLSENLDGAQSDRFAELEARQQDLAQQEADVDAERMRILRQMEQIAGGDSTGTLLERLERNITQAGTTLDGLDAAIAEAGRSVVQSTKEVEECELTLEQAETGLSVTKAAQLDALTRMASAPTWRELRERDLLPRVDLDSEENQRRIHRLRRSCEKCVEGLDAVSSLVREQILAGIVAADQRRSPGSNAAKAVLRLLEERLGRDYFAHPSVAEALFDGGELRNFNLVDEIVEWQPAAAEPVSRHLEAFSSGERAFAYTKTRLERLRDLPPTQNRLVALDEFGAFLERSRLELLEDYLDHDVVGKFVDQALVVLPLSVSREQEKEAFVVRSYRS